MVVSGCIIHRQESGTAVFAREKPLTFQKNFGEHTDEGRAVILEYAEFYLPNVDVPNAQNELKRIDYRNEVGR